MKIESGKSAAGQAVKEKRVRTNRANLLKFLSEKDRFGYTREGALDLGARNFVELAKLYLAHQAELENVFSYARRFKQAAAELTEEDVLEVEKLLAVSKVMES